MVNVKMGGRVAACLVVVVLLLGQGAPGSAHHLLNTLIRLHNHHSLILLRNPFRVRTYFATQFKGSYDSRGSSAMGMVWEVR